MQTAKNFALGLAYFGLVFLRIRNLLISKGRIARVPQLVPTVSCLVELKQQLNICPVITPL
jgi:hypothetical protein